MLVEQAHAPPLRREPDITPFIRFFPPEEIAAIIARIAYLAARALRAYNAEPPRDRIVREICRVRGGCGPWCIGCIGKANAIMKCPVAATSCEPRAATETQRCRTDT